MWQNQQDPYGDAVIIIMLALAVLIGSLVAYLADGKGYDKGIWFLLGLTAWPVALPLIVLRHPRAPDPGHD